MVGPSLSPVNFEGEKKQYQENYFLGEVLELPSWEETQACSLTALRLKTALFKLGFDIGFFTAAFIMPFDF